MKILLVFEGGSRNPRRSGFGVYATVRNNQRTVTHLEFSKGMTANESEYDTLITALEGLSRQGAAGETALEVMTTSKLIAYQLSGTWNANTETLRQRRDRVQELMEAFKSVKVTLSARTQVEKLLK